MGFGFVRDKLEIKVLILYILRRLPAEISVNGLTELVMIDDGFTYFDYIECLYELVDAGHVTEDKQRFKITEKGVRNVDIAESAVAFSVRRNADKLILPVATAMRRSEMIKASHEKTEDGAALVSLSMSDGFGEVFSLRVLAPGDESAERMERYFRENCETLYAEIMELLLRE